MIELYSPESEADLAVMRTILESDGIPFFVHNDHFGSLLMGPSIDLYNKKTIMVSEDHLERARELLLDFISCNSDTHGDESTGAIRAPSWFDKIRMIFETVMFGWFIPGKRYKK